jgi:hypothetical protein
MGNKQVKEQPKNYGDFKNIVAHRIEINDIPEYTSKMVEFNIFRSSAAKGTIFLRVITPFTLERIIQEICDLLKDTYDKPDYNLSYPIYGKSMSLFKEQDMIPLKILIDETNLSSIILDIRILKSTRKS